MAYSVAKTQDVDQDRVWIYYYNDDSWGINRNQRKIFNALDEANSVALVNGGKVIDESIDN